MSIYRKIPAFLGKENKKFQISKIEKGARNREYVGTVEWLSSTGIINICYCMDYPELPLKGIFIACNGLIQPRNYFIFHFIKS